MFEKAARLKLRFPSKVGDISVEDLWDLPLVSKNKANLDDIAKTLNKKINTMDEDSFVVKKSDNDTTIHLMFDIVKHIIAIRLDENDKRNQATKNKQERDKIIQIIAKKEDSELEESSIDDLKKKLDDLSK